MAKCDLCAAKMGFFAAKLRVKYNAGFRVVCRACFAQLEATAVPQFRDRVCATKRVLLFVALFGMMAAVFIAGMTAIGVTQCDGVDDDRGCFIGLFIFGFFGGSLTLFFPMMFWVLTAAAVRNRRLEAAFKLVEAQRHGGANAAAGGGPSGLVVVNGRASASGRLVEVGIPSPAQVASARAAAKAAEIESAPFLPATAPAAPSAPTIDDDDADPDREGVDVDQIEATQCVVCLDAPRTTVLTPCGHVAACKKCSVLLKARGCPICRRPIEAVVDLHIA
jgi:hypothetical protein